MATNLNRFADKLEKVPLAKFKRDHEGENFQGEGRGTCSNLQIAAASLNFAKGTKAYRTCISDTLFRQIRSLEQCLESRVRA